MIHFTVNALDRAGHPVEDFPVRWAVAASGGSAEIDPSGAFVAEQAGTYTVTATLGSHARGRDREGRPRGPWPRGLEVVGRVPIKERSAEVWAHPGGKCVYLSTISDRVYAIDVTTPGAPKIVDSMMANSRIVNDVMTTEDGRYGVFSREGASDRKNGIVDLRRRATPVIPKVDRRVHRDRARAAYTRSYVYQGHVYLTDDATGSMRVIDIQQPATSRRKWPAGRREQTDIGRYAARHRWWWTAWPTWPTGTTASSSSTSATA